MLNDVKIDDKIIIYPAYGIPFIATVRTIFKNGVLEAEEDPSVKGTGGGRMWKLNPSGYEYGSGGADPHFIGKRTYGRPLNNGETVEEVQAKVDRTREALSRREEEEKRKREERKKRAVAANLEELEKVQTLETEVGIVKLLHVRTLEDGRIPLIIAIRTRTGGYTGSVMAIRPDGYTWNFTETGEWIRDLLEEVIFHVFY